MVETDDLGGSRWNSGERSTSSGTRHQREELVARGFCSELRLEGVLCTIWGFGEVQGLQFRNSGSWVLRVELRVGG